MKRNRVRRQILQSTKVSSSVASGRVTRSSVAACGILTDKTNAKVLHGKPSEPLDRNKKLPMKRSNQPNNENPDKRKRLEKLPEVAVETATVSSVETGDAEVFTIVQQMGEIRKILGREYVNVANRLKLDTVPYCVQNQTFCKTHHDKKCPRPKHIERLQSAIVGTFSKQNRRLHYLKSIQDMCVRMEFPGVDVLSNLLDMILVAKPSTTATYTSKYLVEYCAIVAETIIMKFPPCWPDIKKAYGQILLADVDVKKYIPKDSGSKQNNFFVFVMRLLAETVGSIDDEAGKKDNNCQGNDSDSDDEMFGFSTWLQKNSAEESFTQHTREEKLDRLFLVLNIFMKILEHDFSIWLLRYPTKPEQAMFVEATAPLVARIFFDGTYDQITKDVKILLEIFVSCACLPFPKEKVDILSRAVALLSVAINACEKQPNGEIRYPFAKRKADKFAREISRTIENKFGRQIPMFLTVVKAIKIPFTKYLVINHLLYKMNPDPGDMCVMKIYKNFLKKRWLECEDGKRLMNEESSSTLQKYPVTPNKNPKRPKCSSIYQNEYLEVLFDALRAYCEMYQVQNVIRMFCNNTVETIASTQQPSEQTPVKRLNLTELEKDIRFLEMKLKRKQPMVRHEVIEVPYDNICVDAETINQYRDDIKYMGLLLLELRQKHDPIFDEWCEFLDTARSI